MNGTLFSIFSEPPIREEARAIGMEDQLKYLKEASDEQLVRQIDFVLEKLNSGLFQLFQPRIRFTLH